MSVEHQRRDSFARLEDGLRDASDRALSASRAELEPLSIEPASKTAARSTWPGTGRLAIASALGTHERLEA